MPGPVTDAGHVFTVRAGVVQGDTPAVAHQDMASGGKPRRFYLQTLHRGIDEARGADVADFLAEHMPGFQRHAQFQFYVLDMHRAVVGEAEFEEGREPIQLKGIAVLVQVLQHLAQVGPHVMGEHETIMQFRTPPHQRLGIGRVPEARDQGAQQQHLDDAHATMGRHFEGSKFHQAQTTLGAVRRIQLVDAKFGAMGVAGDIHQ